MFYKVPSNSLPFPEKLQAEKAEVGGVWDF